MPTLQQRQELIQRQVPGVREIFDRHSLDASRIDTLLPLIQHFEIRVPFIGAFSSGKSSLLNALLGESLLATEITPETAVPTELGYGAQRRFVGHLPDGRLVPLEERDLQENKLTQLLPSGWVEARLPNPALAARSQLVLVDMPGWDSGIDAHERVIDGYVGRSLAYAVVISIEDGALRENLRRALIELAINALPVVLIVSKADKRPPQDVQAVTERLIADITTLMGHQPLAVAVTSARRKDTRALEAALDALQGRAEEIFEKRVVDIWRRNLEWAIQQLTVLTNAQNKDIPRLEAEIEQLEQELRAFEARLEQETQTLMAQIGPILGTIRHRIENALTDRLESLTDRVLTGLDIRDDILGTARIVVREAVQQEFQPALQRYLDRLVDALPASLDLDLDLDSALHIDEPGSKASGEKRGKTLGTLLGGLLLAVPIPQAKLLAPLLPIIGAIFDFFKDSGRERLEQARQRERVRKQVLESTISATQQIVSHLRPILEEQLEQAQAAARKHVEAERATRKTQQEALIAAKQQGETQAAALRQRAQADIDQLRAMLAALDASGA